jgi:outer membrane receptor for ferrienterochelin and colicins
MKQIWLFIFVYCLSVNLLAQRIPFSNGNVFGHVVDNETGEDLSFVTISVKNTTIGTATDATGRYSFKNLPEGEITLVAATLGYIKQEQSVNVRKNQPVEIDFSMKEDALNLSEVVVTAGRSAQTRTETPVIVNVLSPKMLNVTQSIVLGDGLNFCSGLRYENDCQNCGFSQIRMNGMEGPYSQILINSRPIFSGLAGVYGLELIPSNMLERIEVVRGGGSVLYGSNAIAGTINLILKDPKRNSFEAGIHSALTGAGIHPAADYTANFNASLVTDDYRTGISVYGNIRDRKMFDVNNDGFSEIAPMKNTVVGAHIFHRFADRNKLTLDFFNIREERDGGDKQDYPQHERNIAEAVRHDMKTGNLTFEQYFRRSDLLSVFVSGQYLDRDSYYGAKQSLSSYGKTFDRTYNISAQYKAEIDNSLLVGGLEHTGSSLTDKKLGYPQWNESGVVQHVDNTVISDQSLNTYGAFAQYEIKLGRFKLSAGGRMEHFSVHDRQEQAGDKNGNVFIPRATIMYNLLNDYQLRAAYSRGYRAPQIFDEDLHIETSGSRQVIHKNAPSLKQENSSSFTLSFDFNKKIKNFNVGLLIEAFYTQLHNPFRNEIGLPDEDGVVVYTRVNSADGAIVQGVNTEFKLFASGKFSLNGGFTAQSSRYKKAGNFNEKRFFRTPDTYGFIVADWDFMSKFGVSLTGNYTGKMLVPYFGVNLPEGSIRDTGELRISPAFFDTGIRFHYHIPLSKEVSVEWFAGVKNIFNSYQNDFDRGIDRDPSYIYGPSLPRTVFAGFKIGNLLE